MLHISDDMIDNVLSAASAQAVLSDAFLAYGAGKAAMQARIRTEAQGVKLSTLGAVIPGQNVAGAKVYTTINGQFSFVIVLFSARTGRPLATLDAGALTRIRTAACSVLAAGALARNDCRTLGLFGVGTQGTEHAIQMAHAFGLEQILFCDPYAAAGTEQRLASKTQTPVRRAKAQDIAENADIIVTASRSPAPVFEGKRLRPGSFVAAIGSSLPSTRELDDAALAKATAIVVEWKTQTLNEAGDLILADPSLCVQQKILELSDVLAHKASRQDDNDIFIYKSVGIGLEDIALAGHAYEQLARKLDWAAA